MTKEIIPGITRGQRPSSTSIPVVMSTEQQALLEQVRALLEEIRDTQGDVFLQAGDINIDLDDVEALIALTNAALAALNSKDFATQTTLAALKTRADLLLADATFTGRIGEVQASPTANTLLARLKDIVTAIATLPGDTESTRSWGYVTEVDDDGNVLVGRKPAAESRPVALSDEDKAALDDLKTSLEARLNTLGQKASAASAPVVLSTEQEALLATATGAPVYKAGTASGTGVFIAAFEATPGGYFTISGTTTGSWQDAAGQAGLVAVEGTNDPTGTTGWGALRMENPNGQTTTAPRGGGTFHGQVTTRWLRVNCLIFKAGTYAADLIVFPKPRQLFKHWIGDQDGISRVEVTPGTSRLHTISPTPLLGGNFDQEIDSEVWTVTATGSGTAAIVAGQGVKLQTGTTPDSTIRIQSNRVADIVPGLSNVVNFFAATEAKAGVGNVTRWGAYDDDSGVFLEQYHDGTTGQLRLRTRKSGVDSTVTLNGTNNVSDNGFGVALYNLYEFQMDPAFVKFRQSSILGALASGQFPTLFSKFNLPLRMEIINSGGAATNKTLYAIYASTVRLGPPQTIRANQTFHGENVLSSTASVTHGFPPDFNDDSNTDSRALRTPGRHLLGSIYTPLGGNVSKAGKWFAWQGDYSGVLIDIQSDVAGTFQMQFSEDLVPVEFDDEVVPDESVGLSSDLEDYEPGAGIEPRAYTTQSLWARLKYNNGPAAQTEMVADVAYVTTPFSSGLKPANRPITRRAMVTMVDAVQTVRKQTATDAENDDFVQQKATQAASGKWGSNSTVTRIEDSIVVRPPPIGPGSETFVLSPTPQRIDTPDVTSGLGKRILNVRNAGLFRIFTLDDSGITETNSEPTYIAGNAPWALNPGEELWAICEDVGGSAQNVNEDGVTGTGTATNPGNAVTSDNIYASMTAVAQTLTVTGFTFVLDSGFTAIERLRIGVEGRKQPSQTETVAWAESKSGTTTGAGSVSTSAATAAADEAFLICAITRATGSATVTAVVGNGLTWIPLIQNLTVSTKRMDIWYAVGNATSGTLTASLSASDRATIAVSRYTNVIQSGSVQASNTTTGSGTAVTGPGVSGTNKGYAILAVVHAENSGTAGAGYTERVDIDNGALDTWGGNKALTSTAVETGTMTLASSGPWAAVGLTLMPRVSRPAIVTASYEFNAVAGAITSSMSFDSEADAIQYLDITPDFGTIDPSDVADIDPILTMTSVGGAALQVDNLFLEVRETSGATSRIFVKQYGYNEVQ